jgi:serine/threonine protein kinase
VLKAIWKNKKVAVKKFDGSCPMQQRKDFEKEINVLKEIDHKNIIKLFGYNNKRGNTYLVTELMSGGSLYDHIRCNKINWPKDISLIRDIVEGMAYLHDKEIMHLDLKTLNILLDEDKQVAKISDFGLSRIAIITSITTKSTKINNAKGTVRYMAPEIARGEVCTFKSDVWSFGCILLEMANGEVPFHTLKDSNIFTMLQSEADLPINLCKNTPHSISKLISKCLNKAASRPTFAQISSELQQIKLDKLKENQTYKNLSNLTQELEKSNCTRLNNDDLGVIKFLGFVLG